MLFKRSLPRASKASPRRSLQKTNIPRLSAGAKREAIVQQGTSLSKTQDVCRMQLSIEISKDGAFKVAICSGHDPSEFRNHARASKQHALPPGARPEAPKLPRALAAAFSTYSALESLLLKLMPTSTGGLPPRLHS